MMKMKMILVAIAFLGFISTCFAEARYLNKTQMILNADVIAIVNITKVEKTERQGKHWIYRQKVSATIEECLKGDVKGTIEIYGMETFICAQCNYKVGRFIVFLRKEKDFWAGSNWHLGIRSIKEGNVQWFKDDKILIEMKEVSLQDAIGEITLLVEKQKKGHSNQGISRLNISSENEGCNIFCDKESKVFEKSEVTEMKGDEKKRHELELKMKGIQLPALSFYNKPIEDVIRQLADMSGVGFFLAPRAIEAKPNVTFRTFAPISLWTLLDCILETAGLNFSVEPEYIYISTLEGFQKETPDEETNDYEKKRYELELKIKSIVVREYSFKDVPVKNAIEQLADMTKVNFFIDPQAIKPEYKVTFRNGAFSLWTLLDTMLKTVGLDFQVEPELIRISVPDRLKEVPITKTYRLRYDVQKRRQVQP